nr:heat shock transcription factor 4 [Arabidopsis thaliana]
MTAVTAAQRSVPAPFLSKTYQLVDDHRTDDVVSWNEEGTAFVVWKTAEFAKDLLPQYFKHNNFSSFIRQLNTYGFRKTVPDKWEFANDYFRRGGEDLLTDIRRRKSVIASTAGKCVVVGSPSESNSGGGDDHGSSSTSSPGSSKNPGSVENMVADLSGENEKLKRENNNLSSELAAAKKQRDELVTFLTGHLKVRPEQIDKMIKGGKFKPVESDEESECEGCDGGGGAEEGVGEGLKLFGVWLKGERKKRDRDEKNYVVSGSRMTEIKNVDFHAPLWKSSKVCN